MSVVLWWQGKVGCVKLSCTKSGLAVPHLFLRKGARNRISMGFDTYIRVDI